MNPETADLWYRALQAFRTTKHILNSDPDAAASRAYYAAFYAVSALFALDEKSFSRHSAVEVAVNRELVKTGRWSVELGKNYAFLLRLRSTGDYGGEIHVSKTDAQEALEAAWSILSAVHEASPETFPLNEESR